VKSEASTPYTNSSSGALRSSFNKGFKESLASAITVAAHRGISILCDGQNLQMLEHATSEDFDKMVKKS
jgi:uncharacterized ion transporter superfamily protein YfcC